MRADAGAAYLIRQHGAILNNSSDHYAGSFLIAHCTICQELQRQRDELRALEEERQDTSQHPAPQPSSFAEQGGKNIFH